MLNVTCLSNQQVTFSMHTNSAYTGTQKVKFAVNGQFIQPAVGGKSTIYQTYVYIAPVATPTPIPSPSPSPTPTPAAVPVLIATPSAALTVAPAEPFQFSSLNLSSISDTKMKIGMALLVLR